MHRLPARYEILRENAPALEPQTRTHLKAIRPKDGEEIELFDGLGHARIFRYADSGKSLVAAGELRKALRTGADITLFACVSKGSRWDWTIEKAAELGVRRIVPVISERTIVRLDAAERKAKRERWSRIAEDAARQSGAMWTAEIAEVADFGDALGMMDGMALFAGIISDDVTRPLSAAVLAKKQSLPENTSWGVVIGPEGDFTCQEKSMLALKAEPVSFGSAILRTETAAIFAISVLKAILEGDR